MEEKSSFLPTDEQIFERSKQWAKFMERVVQEEDYKEVYYDEIPTDDDSESEEDNSSENSCSSSDDCTMLDLLDETIPLVEERKRKWKESGMDRVLDTFDIKAITDKVGSWLKQSKLEKSMTTNSSLDNEQIVHSENHKIQFNSDDSLQSVDTAKYILSNRKPRAASCTTMTIKKFRYASEKQKKLQKKYNRMNELGVKQDVQEVFRVSCPNQEQAPCAYKVETLKVHTTSEVPKKSKSTTIAKRKGHHRKKRSDILRNVSVSSSSSCCSTSNCSSHVKPKFRRVRKKYQKKNVSGPDGELTLLPSAAKDDELSPTKTKSNLALLKSPDVTCFLPANIVNSTTISSKTAVTQGSTKNCQLSPIVEKRIQSNFSTPQRKKSIQTRKILEEAKSDNVSGTSKVIDEQKLKANEKSAEPESIHKVLLYTPANKALYHSNLSDGHFKLTEDHLRKCIGRKASRRYIKLNARQLPLDVDVKSTVYFKLPTESENSTGDSDEEDVLYMFERQGELIVQPAPED